MQPTPNPTETATVEQDRWRAGIPDASGAAPGDIGAIVSSAGTFHPSSSIPMVSSNRKLVYRGVLTRADGTHQQAIAMLFSASDPLFYASEVSALARNQLLCVGPEVYELAGSTRLGGVPTPFILEEDAGVSLERAIFSHAPIPGDLQGAPAPLSAVGTEKRDLENRKILYDVLDQVERLHSHGLYHRDVRAANICVKRHGPRPRDIHATLIDHELVTDYEGSRIPASAERYSATLFEELPRTMCKTAARVRPTSLMRDMVYLAALQFELTRGVGVENASPRDLSTWFGRPFARYAATGDIMIRRLDRAADLDPLARQLELVPLDSRRIFDARAIRFARERIAPGGYLDARGEGMLRRKAEFLLQAPIDELARTASYQSWLRECERAGRTPEYGGFDEQPEMLRESNREQIRDIPAKLHALGYRIVRANDTQAQARVTRFHPEEIEELARLEHRRWCEERLAHGWIAGSPRDDERRVHPDLVSYDELPEQSREYNRVAALDIIPVLESAGFAVVR